MSACSGTKKGTRHVSEYMNERMKQGQERVMNLSTFYLLNRQIAFYHGKATDFNYKKYFTV